MVVGGTDQNIYALKAMDHDPTVEGGEKVRFFHPPGLDSFWMRRSTEKDNDGDGKFNEDPGGDMTPITFTTLPMTFQGLWVDDDKDGLIDEGADPDDDEDSSSQVGVVNWAQVDEDEFEWPFRNNDTVVSSPALADMDGNGVLDVVIGADSAGALVPKGGVLACDGSLQ